MKGDLVKVNVRIPLRDFEEIKRLVDEGEYSSVSDFIRDAVEKLVLEMMYESEQYY